MGCGFLSAPGTQPPQNRMGGTWTGALDMASGQLGAVVRQIRRLFGEGTVSGLSDAELLERFVASRDEEAFAALVSAHGPMVLAVCRRVLSDSNDVEDAF